MSIYNTICPLEYRYTIPQLEEEIKKYLSEEAFIDYLLRVEKSHIEVLYQMGICNKEQKEAIIQATEQITAKEVYEKEKEIKHQIRALVEIIKQRTKLKEAKRFVHLFLTSFDVIDTANSLRYKEFTQKLFIPQAIKLLKLLINLSLKYKETPQIGRTHGQFALPITFGFFICGYIDRFARKIKRIKEASEELIGKASGPVGAYNPHTLSEISPFEFERKLLEELNLKFHLQSTQIIHPEPLLELIFEYISAICIIADFSDDLRHLFRSEIKEVYLEYEISEVSSSSMPHKVNPLDFENIKSLWKVLISKMFTLLLDTLSEHQRDLTNSASSRFIPEIFKISIYIIWRFKKSVEKLKINEEKLKENLNLAKEEYISEIIYTILSLNQEDPDTYNFTRELIKTSKLQKRTILQILAKDQKNILKNITTKQKVILENPTLYIGLAPQIVDRVCEYWGKELGVWPKVVTKEEKFLKKN